MSPGCRRILKLSSLESGALLKRAGPGRGAPRNGAVRRGHLVLMATEKPATGRGRRPALQLGPQVAVLREDWLGTPTAGISLFLPKTNSNRSISPAQPPAPQIKPTPLSHLSRFTGHVCREMNEVMTNNSSWAGTKFRNLPKVKQSSLQPQS